VAGLVGLGLLVVPPLAGATPQLPPVAAEELVSSVLAAQKEPFNGTVELDNALGLPELPGTPQAASQPRERRGALRAVQRSSSRTRASAMSRRTAASRARSIIASRSTIALLWWR